MKKTQLKAIIIAFSISIFLTSCKLSDDSDPVILADSYTSLSELVETLKQESQTHTISDPTMANTITGNDGTVINIGANAFTDNSNNTITTPVTARLSEFLTVDKMMKNNVQTSSNGQLLITGGSFEITFEDENGNPANIGPGFMQASMTIQTDTTGLGLNSMNFYVGTRTIVDGREMVNWELGQNAEAWFDQGSFNIGGLEDGLANCDVLYDMAGETATQFEVSITGVTDYSNSTVWMFIEDFPSVIMITQLNDTEDALETYENSIPAGLNATLLAITVDEDNYLKYGSLPITVAGDDSFNVDVDYGTTADLEVLIALITN